MLVQASPSASKLLAFSQKIFSVSPSSEMSSVACKASPPCFALLDDAHAGSALSRLYTGLLEVLVCPDAHSWSEFLQATEAALQQGRHAVALFSYDSGMQLQGIPLHEGQATPSRILLFAHCELLDAQQVAAWLAAQEQSESAGVVNLQASVDASAFAAAIAKVRAYIAAGDTYQVNYTYRLHFSAYGSPLALYRRLRQRQPVPYGALICLPEGEAVLSLSPELFVRHTAGRLFARPMKGTAAATGDDALDQELADSLAIDTKNRAENLMIVDLLRNDLGRIAATGSVTVPRLFEVQRFSSVLQMTSSIEAQLQPQLNLAQIMAALFPCGSITGAPKRRTMEIIRELESEPRGIYTGAIGWFDAPVAGRKVGNFCLSVPIRTLVLQAQDPDGLRRGVLGVGAGIVHDSVASDEYAECQLKAKFLTGLGPEFELFETMHFSREGGCRHMERHLQRLRHSAHYFGFALDEAAIRLAISALQDDLTPQNAYRLRLALRHDGRFDLQSGLLAALPEDVKVLIASEPCQSDALLLRHKTSLRRQYDLAWQTAERAGAFDMLFCNPAGFLTEGGRSNLFIRKNGQWFTPPLSDGVLPGIMRSVLLEDVQLQASEKQLTLADLHAAEEVVLCNALRGSISVKVLVK